VAVATYPGTVSPLRGLDPFGEAERDVLFGRDRAREELAKLVSGDGFRAGLLYGEPGVGKTSLLKAGLLPHLRDHGVVALYCEDPLRPAAAFATALSALGVQPQAGEQPTAFLARAVSATVAGQQFVFAVDDVDAVLHDERTIGELADIFSRVVGRSAGRARFLFACASDRVHLLGGLERRTGSLFPPTSRYELARFPVPEASSVLDRVLALSGVAADPKLAEAVAVGLGRDGDGILPADIQLTAMAMRDLRIDNLVALQRLGGARELERAWLHHICRATGDERGALRLIAEIADGARTVDTAAQRLGFDPTTAQRTLGVLEQAGAVTRTADGGVVLRHPLLAPRIRELTAPARAAAKRAHDLLGSKTATRQRLNLRELLSLRREGIAPVTPDEQAVVARSRRFFKLVAGVIAAIPIAFLILMWLSNRGNVYFDLDPRPGGQRVVVRDGRAGLSAFHWMGFGDVVADTGLSRSMVAPEAWKKIANQDIGADASGWDKDLKKIVAPQLSGLIDYATGNEKALDALAKATQKDPEALAELLIALRPIARGSAAEIALVDSVLAPGAADSSPAVQRAAVALAGAAAQRNPEVYRDTLIGTLMSSDPEQRRIAFAAVRGIGGERARDLFAAALAKNPDASARRELLIEMSAATTDDAPSPSAAASVLSDDGATDALKDRAKSRLRRALADDPAATAAALVGLIAEEKVPADARIFAMGILRELDPLPDGLTGLAEAAHAAFKSHSEAIRAAALPLYARVDPVRAGGDLAALLEDKKAGKVMRKATALGWGELARTNDKAAAEALGRLIKDGDPDVRAAAAVAYGKLGRVAQDQLQKMVKNERYDVAIGAAEGLAVSAEVGASISEAIGGIAQLWKQKGRPRREAARIFARLAKKKSGNVMNYLVAASRSPEDDGLHPIGVEGLCNAANLNNSAEARRNLARLTGNPSTDVRRRLIRCVAEGPDPAKNGIQIAKDLVKDSDGGIRAEAARILAMSAGQGKVSTGVADALLPLIEDGDRDVRLIAVRAVANLGADAPKGAADKMGKVFERGDEGEKLALLRAAKVIQAPELVAMAVNDPSPLVRVEAIDAALAIPGGGGAAILNSSLSDVDPQVRRAALDKLAANSEALEAGALEKALAVAVRDTDPEISQLALTTLARVAPKDAVGSRLGRALASRTERARAQAAAATIGLVDRDAVLAGQLLEPLLDDVSHDVRVALLPSLAAAWAKTNSPEKLASILRGAEKNAMKRLVAAAAFITLAKTDAGKTAATTTLTKLAAGSDTMGRTHAKLALGLIEAKADGIAFLQELVP
jgi:HEAT repeat protein